MGYSQADAWNDIATLKSFWQSAYANNTVSMANDAIVIMRNLIYQAQYDPAIKLIVASQSIFTDALGLEAEALQDLNEVPTGAGQISTEPLFLFDETAPPRWWMLKGIREALEPSFFSLGRGDPSGVVAWVVDIDAAGVALARTISNDPVPDVRLAALQLVKSSALPVSWVRPLIAALDAVDDYVAASPLSQDYRATMAAVSKSARANVLTVANALAQNANFAAFTAPGAPAGAPKVPVGPPPPRTESLPWYKRIELWGALVGGAFSGVKLFERRSR